MAHRRGYIFTNKRHSQRAVMAVILGVISLLSLGAVLLLAYRGEGEVPVGYGFTGLLAACFSLIGLILGIVTVRDKETYHLMPWLAVLLNLLALGIVALILYASSMA